MPLISDADIELISAYIDNQITPSERATFETRIAREPELQQLLDDLQGTVSLLRQLEPVRPSRSFALDPATVAAPRAWGVPAMWLRFGSAFAVLLLAVTLTLDLSGAGSISFASLAGGNNAAAPAAAPESNAAARTNAIPATTVAPAAEALPPPAEPNVRAAESTAVPAAAAMQAADAAAPTEGGAVAGQTGPLSANAGISDPKSSSPDTAMLEANRVEEASAPPAHPLLLVEIGFGALALLLLLASFYVARRRG